MEISAKVDYGTRALLVLSVAYEQDPHALTKGDAIATAQDIPPKFLETILGQLRQARLVLSQRGADGGYRLAKEPDSVSLADIVRALDGPLAAVRGMPPEESVYEGAATHLREVWIATRAAVREVMEHVTLADIASGRLPSPVEHYLNLPGAYERR